MTVEDEPATPRSAKRGALIAGGAPLAAAAISALIVLPAAYRLAQPKTVAAPAPAAAPAARFYPAPYRSDTVEIPLAAKGDPHHGDELEYKVRMKAGGSLVYGWTVDGPADPQQFYYDFHSEGPAGAGGTEPKVVEHRQATGLSSNGLLIAPIDGIHGWYLQNRSPKPVMVKLKLSGFYALVPPGEDGNEGAIEANTPGGYSKTP